MPIKCLEEKDIEKLKPTLIKGNKGLIVEQLSKINLNDLELPWT